MPPIRSACVRSWKRHAPCSYRWGRSRALLAGGVHAQLAEPLRSHLQLADWGLVLQGPDERVEGLFQRLDKNQDGKLQPREWRERLAASIGTAIRPGRNPTLTREEVDNFYRKNRPYLSLESKQLLLEPFLADAALAAAKESHLRAAPTLVYLANTIAIGSAEIPYSVVAALDPAQLPPLGPFLPAGVTHLADDEIVLADWKASPLPPKIGAQVTLSFF